MCTFHERICELLHTQIDALKACPSLQIQLHLIESDRNAKEYYNYYK